MSEDGNWSGTSPDPVGCCILENRVDQAVSPPANVGYGGARVSSTIPAFENHDEPFCQTSKG
jgi:hypothetical protein